MQPPGDALVRLGRRRRSENVELVARRQTDLDQGYPNNHVYAGAQLVGRIYQSAEAQWHWAINSVMIDSTAGGGMSGYAPSMEEARLLLRLAFDRWLAWALAIPPSDLKYGPLDKNLRAMGAR